MALRSWAKALGNNLVPPSKDGGNTLGRKLAVKIKNNEVCSPNELPLASVSGNKKASSYELAFLSIKYS